MKDENLFTDAQIERIKELIREEGNIQLGKAAFKIIFLALGSLITGAVAGILTYLGVKH
jgi:hypothetical protein